MKQDMEHREKSSSMKRTPIKYETWRKTVMTSEMGRRAIDFINKKGLFEEFERSLDGD